MEQPQSADEIASVVGALQRLDPLLDLRWEPKAFETKPAVLGDFRQVTKLAEYDARWQVIRWSRATSIHLDREYTVILTVTKLDQSSGVPVMRDRGDYAPIGWWLVDYMALIDAAQGRLYEEHRKILDREHEAASALSDDFAAHEAALERKYHEWGGEHIIGVGFGKGRRSCDPIASGIVPALN